MMLCDLSTSPRSNVLFILPSGAMATYSPFLLSSQRNSRTLRPLPPRG